MTREVISRDAFMNLAKRKPPIDVPLPQLGNGTVVPVWALSVRERTAFEKRMQTKSGKTDPARQQEVRERLVVECCRNDDGTPIFTLADVQALSEMDASIIEPIVEVALKQSGFTNGDVERLAKNSDATGDA